MNSTQAKKVPILFIANKLGLEFEKSLGTKYFFKSPQAAQKTGSLRCDIEKNLFIDYLNNRGGATIELVMYCLNCDFVTALKLIESIDTTQNIVNLPIYKPYSQLSTSNLSIEILKVKELSNKALIDYLIGRNINTDLVKNSVYEVYYETQNKKYFAVGFKNILGCFELRNKYFKGSSSKAISFIDNHSENLLVFEGFIDYLSYLTYNNSNAANFDIIVLNGVGQLHSIAPYLCKYNAIGAYLDNDIAGLSCYNELKEYCTNEMIKCTNLSVKFAPCKDFNDFLCFYR
jgi:hypothetical protein